MDDSSFNMWQSLSMLSVARLALLSICHCQCRWKIYEVYEGYRAPTFQDEKAKNLLSPAANRGDLYAEIKA